MKALARSRSTHPRSQFSQKNLLCGLGAIVVFADKNAGDVSPVERKPGLPIGGDGVQHNATGQLVIL